MAALYEELKKKKSELGITTEQLSRLSGVPVGTINKILNGETKSPRYDALPDDVRAELIDGELIFLEAPSSIHQELITELLLDIGNYIRNNKGPCKVLPAPLDVQLDCDNRTMIQPDISVICQKERIVEKGVYGAPDFCIEIVSPSSRKRDYSKKVDKYMSAGVREYWIVDPKRETILCYFFETEDYPQLYTFNDIIPVQIYQENLKINFAEIKARL